MNSRTLGPGKDILSIFRRGAMLFPQPVAIATGRVVRARSDAEKVDSCLKAAEVLTRYLAAVCVSSFAAREGAGEDDLSIPRLSGNLSFGHFLQVCQFVAKSAADHPCGSYLAGFRPKGRGPHKKDGTVDTSLVSLLELRNDLGHDLATLTAARSESILENQQPVQRLANALDGLKELLACPLLVIDNQKIERRRVWALCLWLMGESVDPDPVEVEVQAPGVDECRTPYVAFGDRMLRLDPLLLWGVVPERGRYGILVVDAVGESGLRYQTLDPIEIARKGEQAKELAQMLSGEGRPIERVTLPGGSNLHGVWRELRGRIEQASAQLEGALPWDDFDRSTLEWYAHRLAPEDDGDPPVIVRKVLFDGRATFNAEEIRQSQLLFGTEGTVRKALGRAIIDMRVRVADERRWEERIESTQNVFAALKAAVDFFARYLRAEVTTLDELTETTGSADYLAMREALVNLFIHQDYADAGAAGQIELRPEAAMFFNPGFSLVPEERLVEGGKSHCRNPLIARALRLVGFAELAGSGIISLTTAWRRAQRKPPQFQSDRENNAFTVRLDWRPVINAYDEVWKDRIGVRLTKEQASVLNLALDPAGVTPMVAAAGTGVSLEEAEEILRYLAGQMLLKESAGTYLLADHLKEILA